MATAGNINDDVDFGVGEEDGTITLMYVVPDPVKRITWQWDHQQAEDGSTTHVAHMIAQDSKLEHVLKPIPDHIYKILGENPKKKRDDIYLKVILKKKEKVSIREYFKPARGK